MFFNNPTRRNIPWCSSLPLAASRLNGSLNVSIFMSFPIPFSIVGWLNAIPMWISFLRESAFWTNLESSMPFFMSLLEYMSSFFSPILAQIMCQVQNNIVCVDKYVRVFVFDQEESPIWSGGVAYTGEYLYQGESPIQAKLLFFCTHYSKTNDRSTRLAQSPCHKIVVESIRYEFLRIVSLAISKLRMSIEWEYIYIWAYYEKINK